MEFLEGESLRQALTRRDALPVPEVAEILQQAARGLNAAHKVGIIHRDLKPDNIFLTYPDDESVAPASPPAAGVSPPANVQVKIVDFGIAKLRDSAHTQTGMGLGTPAYMSFEQASGMRSDELDARSDVYSLGVVARCSPAALFALVARSCSRTPRLVYSETAQERQSYCSLRQSALR